MKYLFTALALLVLIGCSISPEKRIALVEQGNTSCADQGYYFYDVGEKGFSCGFDPNHYRWLYGLYLTTNLYDEYSTYLRSIPANEICNELIYQGLQNENYREFISELINISEPNPQNETFSFEKRHLLYL